MSLRPLRLTPVTIRVLVALVVLLPVLRARGDATVEVDGFARVLEAANSGDYPTNRSLTLGAPSSWAHGQDGTQTVTWETAPVPADLAAHTVVFAWSCGLSRGPGTHELLLNGEPLLGFTSGSFGTAQRWSGDGAVLEFSPEVVDFAGEVHGTMYLSLPASRLTPGQPALLSVRAIDGGDWFMLHHYTGSHDFARGGAAALPSGRRVILPPPKALYVPSSLLAWEAPFRIAADSAVAEDVEIVARLRDAAGADVTDPVRRTVHVEGDARFLPVTLWAAEAVPAGAWTLALNVGAPGQPASGRWEGGLVIGDVSAFETAAAAAATMLADAAAAAAPGSVLADISVPTAAYRLEQARQQLLAAAAPDQLEVTLQGLRDTADEVAAAAAQIVRGHDPYADQRGFALRAYRSGLDGQLQPYGLYVPEDYTPGRACPLVIMLHGSGSDPSKAMRRVLGTGSLAPPPAAAGFLVVTPHTRGDLGWGNEVGEDDVLRVLADVRRTHAVDPDRIYLTGLSMGGHGTWHLGLRYPDVFAALAPVCGFTTWRVYAEDAGLGARIRDELDPLVYADNALHLPIFVHHGDADPAVNVENSRRMVARLDSLGYDVEYTEYPAVGHNSWDLAYANGQVFTWFARHRRDPWPARIVHVAAEPRRYGRDRWVRIDGLARPHELGRVDARIEAGNRLVLETRNVAELSLQLQAPLIDPDRPVRVERADGAACHDGAVPADGWLTLQMDAQGCTKVSGDSPPAPPYGGLAGFPLGFHALVYGTAGQADLVAAGRDLAERFARPWHQRLLEFPVVADTALTPAQREGDLVLIGTPATNAVLAALMPELPLRWDKGLVIGRRRVGTDEVLLLSYRQPRQPDRRLFVICAATAAPLQRLTGLPQGTPEWAVLAAGDSVVAMGTFDRTWTRLETLPLPSAAP